MDEILRTFLDELFARYREIVDAGLEPKQTLKALVVASFETIDSRHAEVAIYQNESKHLMPLPRFSYLEDRNVEFRKLWTVLLEDGMGAGVFRADLDVDLAYRFIRDTVWVAVRWYRPGGGLSADAVADQYLAILLDGIATGRRKNSKT